MCMSMHEVFFVCVFMHMLTFIIYYFVRTAACLAYSVIFNCQAIFNVHNFYIGLLCLLSLTEKARHPVDYTRIRGSFFLGFCFFKRLPFLYQSVFCLRVTCVCLYNFLAELTAKSADVQEVEHSTSMSHVKDAGGIEANQTQGMIESVTDILGQCQTTLQDSTVYDRSNTGKQGKSPGQDFHHNYFPALDNVDLETDEEGQDVEKDIDNAEEEQKVKGMSTSTPSGGMSFVECCSHKSCSKNSKPFMSACGGVSLALSLFLMAAALYLFTFCINSELCSLYTPPIFNLHRSWRRWCKPVLSL